jgi:nitrite reductase (NADH) small subunit
MSMTANNHNLTICSNEGRAVALGSVDRIPPGEGRCFRIGAARVALFRQRDGAVFALDGRCPHAGGPLADGLIGAGVVVCPLHGRRFRLADGAALEDGPAVRSYPVEVREGGLWLSGVDES